MYLLVFSSNIPKEPFAEALFYHVFLIHCIFHLILTLVVEGHQSCATHLIESLNQLESLLPYFDLVTLLQRHATNVAIFHLHVLFRKQPSSRLWIN